MLLRYGKEGGRESVETRVQVKHAQTKWSIMKESFTTCCWLVDSEEANRLFKEPLRISRIVSVFLWDSERLKMMGFIEILMETPLGLYGVS